MKKLLLLLIGGITIGTASAQQAIQYSNYMVNSYLINPALAGTEDYVDMKASYRQQWAGLEGSPTTMYLTGHSPIGEQHEYYHYKGEHRNWHGAGGMVVKDDLGLTNTLAAYGSYSYNMVLKRGKYKVGNNARKTSTGVRASFGMFLGFQNYKIDAAALQDYNEVNGNPTLDQTVLEVKNGNDSKFMPDASFGTWIYSDSWYVGASAFQLFGNQLGITTANEDAGVYSKLSRHFFVTAGYKAQVSEYWYVLPSVLMKGAEGSPSAFDLNCRVDYKDEYFGGFSYRFGSYTKGVQSESIVAMLGAVLNYTIEVAYSYDITLSDIRNYSNGSHEIIVGYRFLPRRHFHIAENHWK